MDRNTIVGLLLVGAILFGFSWYSSRQAKEVARQKHVADSIARAEGRLIETPENVADIFTSDTLQAAGAQQYNNPEAADSLRRTRIGTSIVDAEHGEEKFFNIENEVISLTFSNLGGKIVDAELKNYKTFYDEPLKLYAEGSARFNMLFYLRDIYNSSVPVNTENLYFQCDLPGHVEITEGDGVQMVSMKLPVDSTAYIEYLHTIYPNDYMIDFHVNFVGMDNHISNQQSLLNFSWGSIAPQQERGFLNENRYSSVSYKYPGDDGIDDLGMSEGSKNKTVKSNLQWIAFKQQFFSVILVANDNYFMNSELAFDTFAPEDKNLKQFSAQANVMYSRNKTDYGFRFYFGPNKYSQLRTYDLGMERLINLGWPIVRHVNKWIVIPVFNWLSKHLSSMGLIILLLTIMIKIIILPLTYRSYLSMGKMRLLKPEIDEINGKYPKQEDAMKKQQAVMELYKRAGVSPMGGCLPMLIQFPILVALFYFFPTSIELRGESFLWAKDLSTYDSILDLPFKIPMYGDHVSLFTLLMAVSLFLSTKFNPQQQASGQMGSMKMLMYFMPVMLLVFFNNYASGLTYYYLLSNLLTMGQTWGFKYAVNDEKLHARMKANASKNAGKKPKKKSNWQKKYEDMVREQQRQAASGKGKKK